MGVSPSPAILHDHRSVALSFTESFGPNRMALLLPLTDAAAQPALGTRQRNPTIARPSIVRSRGRVARVAPLFSGPVLQESFPSSPLKKQLRDGGDDQQDYYVNLGQAIRTLREELPEIFHREPSFEIYREDIVFKDPLNTFFGIENYKLIFWALQFTGQLFFRVLWLDVVSIWQPVENIIMIRWTVHGVPRVPWESRGRFDGTSEYKLDKNGKIYEHKVDNVALSSPPKFRVLAVEEMILSLGSPSTPKPTCFETALLTAISYVPFLLRFMWVRYYLAFYLTLVWRSAIAV